MHRSLPFPRTDDVGRRAGTTTDETKAAILKAAAKVFACQGFEGASIAEITAEAGLSSGPIYGHFGSKAELFAATLEAHTDRELDSILGSGGKRDASSILASLGSALSRRHASRRSLLVEAIVASRRDPAVAALVSDIFARRQARLVRLIEAGQVSGEIAAKVSPEAVARFSVVIGLGSLLIGALDQGNTDEDEWQHLIAAVVSGLLPR